MKPLFQDRLGQTIGTGPPENIVTRSGVGWGGTLMMQFSKELGLLTQVENNLSAASRGGSRRPVTIGKIGGSTNTRLIENPPKCFR